MTTIGEWIKRMFDAIMPSPEGNAWDELKRARALEVQKSRVAEERVALRAARRYQ